MDNKDLINIKKEADELYFGRISKIQNKLDKYIEILWGALEDVPFVENENKEQVLDGEYLDFKKGSTLEDIWHWFDERYSKGVSYLLNEYKITESPEIFIKKEIKERQFNFQDYKYLIECTLSNSIDTYKNQYLLVNDYKNQSENDIDLKGNCCFNCDFKIVEPKLIKEIHSLDEVIEFCKTKKIDLEDNLDNNGNLIVGAEKNELICKDLNKYDREIDLESEESEEDEL